MELWKLLNFSYPIFIWFLDTCLIFVGFWLLPIAGHCLSGGPKMSLKRFPKMRTQPPRWRKLLRFKYRCLLLSSLRSCWLPCRREEALKKRSAEDPRSPICCILGHVDTGMEYLPGRFCEQQMIVALCINGSIMRVLLLLFQFLLLFPSKFSIGPRGSLPLPLHFTSTSLSQVVSCTCLQLSYSTLRAQGILFYCSSFFVISFQVCYFISFLCYFILKPLSTVAWETFHIASSWLSQIVSPPSFLTNELKGSDML